jgi:hypothetical protein
MCLPRKGVTMIDTNANDKPTSGVNPNAELFAALEVAGIHRVEVEFNGSGDDGCIDSVTAYDANEKEIPIPQTLQPAEGEYQGAIESVCDDYLGETHDGWEINDGAYGTFTFEVVEKKITLDFNQRFTNVENFSHEF